MQLRDYQRRAVDELNAYLRNGSVGNPIVALPGASGKSVVQAKFIQQALETRTTGRILCCTHILELIVQNHEKLHACWPFAPSGIYSASVGRREAMAQILFCGIQTVYNKAHEIGWVDFLFIDEAHLLPADANSQYRVFIAALRAYNHDMRVIGLTATPYRTGQGLLTDGENALFTDIILDLTQGEELVKLIDDGYLAPLHPKGTDTHFDLTKVRTTAGEFNSKDLEAACNTDEITRAIVAESVIRGCDRNTRLWFCAGVKHALAVRNTLRAAGYPCETITGGTPKAERKQILEDFKAGCLRDVTNANVLTTGTDVPRLDMIVMARATKSASLHVQMLARGMRIFPGKTDCLVLDFAGNTARLGPINAIRIPKQKGKAGGSQDAPTKECPACKEIVPVSARVCAACGHEFPPPAPQLSATPGQDKLIVRAEDLVEDWTVDAVRYSTHEPPGKRASLKVTYECGLRSFHEWITLGYPGFPGSKAANWWMARSDRLAPGTVDEAMTRTSELNKPRGIRVNTAGKYPEIVSHAFN